MDFLSSLISVSNIGVLLVVLGLAIQFWDWKRVGNELELIENIGDHLERLKEQNEHTKNIKAPPKGELITKDGVDIGEALEIMSQAGDMAEASTKETLRETKERLSTIKGRHYPFVLASWAFVIVGTLMTVSI